MVEVNQRSAAVARAAGREQLRCLKRGGAGKEEHPGTCTGADPRGKLGRAIEKAARAEAKKCPTAPPPFGYTGVENATDMAIAASLEAVGELLGVVAEDSLARKKEDRAGAKCQADLTKRMLAVHDAVWSEAARAKRSLLGGKAGGAASAAELADAIVAALAESSRLAKREQALVAGAEKRCGGVDSIYELFPGECDGYDAADTAACIAVRARCEACIGLRRADYLPLACDTFDDGAENGSCVWPFPTHVTPELDTDHAAEATIGPAGGSLVATGGDGTVFTLDVPADALAEEVAITRTPVAAVPDLPVGSFAAAVQLLPEGLVFPIPGGAQLTIELPAPVSDLKAFGWLGGGDDFHLQLAEAGASTLVFRVFHFSGVGGTSGDLSDVAATFGFSSWRNRADNELAALADQGLDPSDFNERAAEIMRRWLRGGVFVTIARAERAPAFFELALGDAAAWLSKAQLILLLDNLWGEGPLEDDAAELRERLTHLFFTALDSKIQICMASGDANRFIDDVVAVENLALRFQLEADEDFLTYVQDKCIKVETDVVSIPDDLEPSESAAFQLRSWWVDPFGHRHTDEPPIYIQTDEVGGEVTPNHGDSDPQGVFDATVRADEDPPVSIRITVMPSLRLVVLGTPFEVWVGEQVDCGWRAGALPPGSYDQSCSPCSVDGTVLECTCRKINGSYQPAEIDFSDCHPDEDLSNLDGVLVCGECP